MKPARVNDLWITLFELKSDVFGYKINSEGGCKMSHLEAVIGIIHCCDVKPESRINSFQSYVTLKSTKYQ